MEGTKVSNGNVWDKADSEIELFRWGSYDLNLVPVWCLVPVELTCENLHSQRGNDSGANAWESLCLDSVLVVIFQDGDGACTYKFLLKGLRSSWEGVSGAKVQVQNRRAEREIPEHSYGIPKVLFWIMWGGNNMNGHHYGKASKVMVYNG